MIGKVRHTVTIGKYIGVGEMERAHVLEREDDRPNAAGICK